MSSRWLQGRSLKLCYLALIVQCLVVFGSLVPESAAFDFSGLFGGGKKEDVGKKKSQHLAYRILRPSNFEKNFDEIKSSGTKELSVVLCGINAEQEYFAPFFRTISKKYQNDPQYVFYRLNLVSESEYFELPEKQYGPYFNLGAGMGGRYFHILLIRNGDWRQAAMLHMGYNSKDERKLRVELLEKELELRRGEVGSASNVISVKKGQTWEDVKYPYTMDGVSIVGYIPDKKSSEYAFFEKVAVPHGAWDYADVALYYHTADPAFIKSIDADTEVDAPAVYVIQNMDGLVKKLPLDHASDVKAFKALLHEASFPQFMDRSSLDLNEVYAKHTFLGKWYQETGRMKRNRLEFVAPEEKWTQVAKVVKKAMATLLKDKEENKYFVNDFVFMHKTTPEKYSYGEIVFKLLNDTREVVLIATSQFKTTATKVGLFWKDETCCNTVEDLTVDKVRSFMISVGANEIQPVNDKNYGKKSERAPFVNKGPLFKVVGTTFDAFVNSGKNVLIYFFARSNEASVTFEKNEMKDIANVFKGEEDITIGKINGAKNVIKDSRFKVTTYPDLYFINTEMEVIRYEGMYLKEDIIAFVRKHRTKIFTKDDVIDTKNNNNKEEEEPKEEL